MRNHRNNFPERHHTIPHLTGDLNLSALKKGETGVVTGVAGKKGVMERITSLGFVPGTELTILQNFGHGPIIVRAHDARIALGRGVAAKVLIRRR